MPTPSSPPRTQQEMHEVQAKLDALTEQVRYLVERQRKQEELIAEMMPIAKLVMASAVDRLDELDKKGYFAFGREALRVGERIVESYGPEDVRALGGAVSGILDTVKALTQPEVLKVAGEATVALAEADRAEPIGLVGMVRASRDEDVQKGMAVLMELLRHVGRGARAAAESRARSPEQVRRRKLADKTASKGAKRSLGVERRRATDGAVPAPPPAARSVDVNLEELGPPGGCAVPSDKPVEVAVVIEGVGFTADGYLADPARWTRTLGARIAGAEGIDMTEAHWKIVDTAREDFLKNGASPNIRRLTQAAQVTTRDIYALFPRAPGRTVAKIAGIPRPAGCL